MRICKTERAKSPWLSGYSTLLQLTVDVGLNPLIMQNSHSVHTVKLGASQFPVVIPGRVLDNKYQVDQQLTVVGFLMVRSEHSQFSEVTIKN